MADAAPASAATIDEAWLRANPLPHHGEGTDKNSRGHVIVMGGSRQVPGGLRLTGEAAFRSGAGKVQLAAPASCVLALGVALPEAGVIALDESAEGELEAAGLAPLAAKLERCDSLVVGPAMTSREVAGAVLDALLDGLLDGQPLLLDAVVLHAARGREDRLRAYGGQLIVTPNPDELASCLGCDEARVSDDPAACAREIAALLGAVAVCKGPETFVAAPDGTLLHYAGGGVGLATGGSGDVLAGILAGLVARGCEPLTAAAWSVWLHGEAGKRLAEWIGPIGFLARELLSEVPGLMDSIR